jgi:ATP-dependent Clp protease protease subunit
MILQDEFRNFAVKGMGMNGLALDQYMDNTFKNLTTHVIEERERRFSAIDIFTRLIADRIIFLGTPIDDYVSNVIVAQLLFLESLDSKKDILVYINSPGGSVYAGLGIYDTMHIIKPEISTICTSMAASMGAVLLCAGTKGKRTALPHARVMIHQPFGGAQGQASDVAITAREIQKVKKELYEIIANHSGQSFDKVSEDSDRDYWLSAQEAKEYGLIDEVLLHNAEKKQ